MIERLRRSEHRLDVVQTLVENVARKVSKMARELHDQRSGRSVDACGQKDCTTV